MRYVEIISGIPSKPKGLSGNPTVSPNKKWGVQQMYASGFRVVKDTPFNSKTHKQDFDNPIITGAYIEYPLLEIPVNEQLGMAKKIRTDQLYAQAHNHLDNKYNPIMREFAANGDSPQSVTNEIKQFISDVANVVGLGMISIDSATTVTEVEALTFEFPE